MTGVELNLPLPQFPILLPPAAAPDISVQSTDCFFCGLTQLCGEPLIQTRGETLHWAKWGAGGKEGTVGELKNCLQ